MQKSFFKTLRGILAGSFLLFGSLITATSAKTQSPPEASLTKGAMKKIEAHAPDLSPKTLKFALLAYQHAKKEGLDQQNLLSIIDFSLPSSAKRFWVINMNNDEVLYHTYVAHGKNSGNLYATHFSNKNGSKESSIGTYLTANPYYGHDGYSLRLKGLEKGVNNNALKRDIVIHGSWYATGNFVKNHGRLGRSWGCPALPKNLSTPIINKIKEGSLVFAYYPQHTYLSSSPFLHMASETLVDSVSKHA